MPEDIQEGENQGGRPGVCRFAGRCHKQSNVGLSASNIKQRKLTDDH
jgi:hypothetical protein